jgi:PKD repeat protein
MNRLILSALALSLYTSLALYGCDDDQPPVSFDVLVSVDRTSDNAPATFTFSSQSNGPLQGEYTYQWAFGDGEESEEESPQHIYNQPGEYEVSLLISEASGGRGEGRISVLVMPPVNLEVSNLSFTPMTTLSQDQEGLASWLFKQSTSAANPWQFGLYLVPSQDGQPIEVEATEMSLSSSSIILLSNIPYPGLDLEMGDLGTREESVELPFIIPSTVESGDYFLAVVADDENNVGELNRMDNITFSPVPLRIRGANDDGPDFSLCGLSVSSFVGIEAGQRPLIPLGEQLSAQVCIANLGDRPVIESPYAIYLSQDATLDDDDILLSQGVEQAIGPNDRLNFEVLLDIPIETDPGIYRLLGVADPEETELERQEDNNLRASPIPFELVEPGDVEGVDLVVTSVSIDRDRIYWGQKLTGMISLTHRGDLDVSRLFVIRFNGLPVDMGIPPQQLPSLNVNGIEAGSTLELPFELSLSPRVPEGRYRLQVEVDPTNSTNDVNPSNNRRSTPDIISLGGAPNYDPAARSLTLSQMSIEAGQDLSLILDISNLGDDPTGNFNVALYLSSDMLIGAGDHESMFFDVDSLEGGESRELELSFNVPITLDQAVNEWYVAAKIDPQRTLSGELSDENNLVFSESRLQVTGTTGGCGEDGFEDNDSAAQATTLEAGDYQNLGACDAADWFSVDLPANTLMAIKVSAVESDDGERILPTLELGEGSGMLTDQAELRDEERVIIVPASNRITRPYFKVSSAGTPINYNLMVSLFEQSNAGSLLLSDLSVTPGVAEAGGPVELSVQLTNLGQAQIAGGELTLELVNTATLDSVSLGTPTYEGVENAWLTPDLSPGTSVQTQARFILPDSLSDGLYFIRATHSELDQADNRYAWALAPLRIDEAQACSSDRFEPNGSPHEIDGVSMGAEAVGNGSFSELFACVNDDDWYRITLEAGDALDAEIIFDRLSGDLDLELYEADGQTLVAQSESLQGRESVTIFRSATTSDYLLRIFLKPSDQVNVATEYTMNIEIGASQSCGDDGFEPNSNALEAALLPDGPHDLVVCPGGEDWFRFQVPAGNIVSYTVSVGFDDVELSLFDPNDMLIDTNNRRIYHEALITGTYRLRVIPTQQVSPAPYTLLVSGVSGLDLAASNLMLTSTSGGPGDELYADVSIENRRGDLAEDILVRFVLSDDLRISLNDPILGEQEIPRIEGASSVNIRQRITIPNGLDAGIYSVICEVDPELSLDDFYLSNNVIRTNFEVSEACVDDDERENEGPRTATPLDWMVADQSYEGVICALTEDWLVVTVPAGERVFTLNTEGGDLDLTIYQTSNQNVLGSSQTLDPVEEVNITLVDETEVYIQVDGFFNERGTYTLTWQ